MSIGEEVRAEGTNILVLDIQKNYLILFNKYKKQFIKANNWKEYYEIVSWSSCEYYFSLNELIKNIN